MRFALVVSAAPDVRAQPLHFAAALLGAGHALPRVFFLRDGVRHGLPGSAVAESWLQLQARHPAVELALCIGAAERRAIPTAAGDASASTGHGFVHVGLGQLVAALAEADRVVDFPA